MSAQLNEIAGIAVQIPLTGCVNQNEGVANEKLKTQLQEIDARIETWMNICRKENINIFPEMQELTECRRKPAEAFTLKELVDAEERICQSIVQKVKGNLRREPTREALETTRSRLEELTIKSIPWFYFAKEQRIDIKDEFNTLREAYRSSLEKLGEDAPNKDNVKEVVQKRLYSLRLDCTIRVINKIFRHTILKSAEKEQSVDWFDDKRVEIINGIASDALSKLPTKGSLEQVQQGSTHVLTCFNKNLELVRKDLAAYEKMADREWLKREVQKKGLGLARYASERGNLVLMREILQTLRYSLAFFETSLSTKEIRERTIGVFKLYAERLSLSANLIPCGSYKGLGSSNRDNEGSY